MPEEEKKEDEFIEEVTGEPVNPDDESVEDKPPESEPEGEEKKEDESNYRHWKKQPRDDKGQFLPAKPPEYYDQRRYNTRAQKKRMRDPFPITDALRELLAKPAKAAKVRKFLDEEFGIKKPTHLDVLSCMLYMRAVDPKAHPAFLSMILERVEGRVMPPDAKKGDGTRPALVIRYTQQVQRRKEKKNENIEDGSVSDDASGGGDNQVGDNGNETGGGSVTEGIQSQETTSDAEATASQSDGDDASASEEATESQEGRNE